MNIDKREMNNIRKKNLSEKRTILPFEIVSINSLLIVPRYHFYEKELSESSDERYLSIISILIQCRSSVLVDWYD
jgi:hypothetical protein